MDMCVIMLNIGNIMARGKEGADRELKQIIQCVVCKCKISLRKTLIDLYNTIIFCI